MYLFLCPDLVNALAEALEAGGRISAVKLLHKVEEPVQLGLGVCNRVICALGVGAYSIDHKGYYAFRIA